MKLRHTVKINFRRYPKGTEISWLKVYPLFLLHMLTFGVITFVLAYAETDAAVPAGVIYVLSGFGFVAYLAFYFSFFGWDPLRWIAINTALGLLAYLTQIDAILSLFDRVWADYPLSIHLVPALYFPLYTFFLRQALLDLTASREDPEKAEAISRGFSVTLAMLFMLLYLL